MKLEVEIDRELLQLLGPYSFFILVYFKGIYATTGKISSFNKASKDLNLSYLKVRSSLAHVFFTIYKSNTLTSSQLKRVKESYSFIESKSEEAYNTINNLNKKKEEEGKKTKGLEQQQIWNRIVSRMQEAYAKKIPASFYWRTSAWIDNLIKNIGKENIDHYMEWWLYNKKDKVGKFNAGIFCCDNMTQEYNKDPKKRDMITRKKIESKRKVFEEKADKQNRKILGKITLKIEKGIPLDKYDKEMLEFLGKEGIYVR